MSRGRSGSQAACEDRDGALEKELLLSEIWKMGGKTEIDSSVSGGPVVAVDRTGTAANDSLMRRLTLFPKLRSLGLNETKVTDGGLEVLEEFSELDRLGLRGMGLTDRGMEHVGDCARLRHVKNLMLLDVSDTQVSDAGILKLATLENLQTLFVRGSRVTAAGAEALKKDLPGVRVAF